MFDGEIEIGDRTANKIKMHDLRTRDWGKISKTLLTDAESELFKQMTDDVTDDEEHSSDFWRNGQRLKVFFMDGATPSQCQKVKDFLDIHWARWTNLKFLFVDSRDKSDVRLELRKRGMSSESIVGVTRESKSRKATTGISFARNADAKYGLRGDQANILHELGHLLGLEHEHQRHD